MNKTTKQIWKEEGIRAFYLALLGILAFLFIEKSKISNQVKYQKKIEILSDERKEFQEINEKFSLVWHRLLLSRQETSYNDCLNYSDYVSYSNELILLYQRADILLAGSLLDEKVSKSHQEELKKIFDKLNKGIISCSSNDANYIKMVEQIDIITAEYNKQLKIELE